MIDDIEFARALHVLLVAHWICRKLIIHEEADEEASARKGGSKWRITGPALNPLCADLEPQPMTFSSNLLRPKGREGTLLGFLSVGHLHLVDETLAEAVEAAMGIERAGDPDRALSVSGRSCENSAYLLPMAWIATPWMHSAQQLKVRARNWSSSPPRLAASRRPATKRRPSLSSVFQTPDSLPSRASPATSNTCSRRPYRSTRPSALTCPSKSRPSGRLPEPIRRSTTHNAEPASPSPPNSR